MIREGRLIACDRVEALAKTNAKRISLRGRTELAGLEGIRDLQTEEDGMSFLYSGSMDALLNRLAAGEILDLNVTDPDLEEIFLHYYEKEGDVT